MTAFHVTLQQSVFSDPGHEPGPCSPLCKWALGVDLGHARPCASGPCTDSKPSPASVMVADEYCPICLPSTGDAFQMGGPFVTKPSNLNALILRGAENSMKNIQLFPGRVLKLWQLKGLSQVQLLGDHCHRKSVHPHTAITACPTVLPESSVSAEKSR